MESQIGTIYRAIERQDADDARAAMRMHLSNSRERFRRAHALSAADGRPNPSHTRGFRIGRP
jgi:DNA-binding GntR family transcriptional regulator